MTATVVGEASQQQGEKENDDEEKESKTNNNNSNENGGSSIEKIFKVHFPDGQPLSSSVLQTFSDHEIDRDALLLLDEDAVKSLGLPLGVFAKTLEIIRKEKFQQSLMRDYLHGQQPGDCDGMESEVTRRNLCGQTHTTDETF